MKKLIALFFLTAVTVNAQISFDQSYSNKPITLNKLHVSGYKYQQIDIANKTIKLYNINHTLYKTITIPTLTGTLTTVSYVSENLFDTDNLIEFAALTYSSVATNTMFPGDRPTLYICKENGTVVFSKDSANLGISSTFNVFSNYENIYTDGTATKMRLSIFDKVQTGPLRSDIYTLPGTIPCVMCSDGIVAGRPGREMAQPEVLFYPNPVSDQLKLKYSLPEKYQKAQINIYDMQGKLIEEFQVTDTFDHIYLPTSFNNGMYLYTLIVDGQKIKTEKIILSK